MKNIIFILLLIGKTIAGEAMLNAAPKSQLVWEAIILVPSILHRADQQVYSDSVLKQKTDHSDDSSR